MESNITWRIVAGALATYYVTLAFYRLFFHSLARFPGPRLAAISRWYEAYYDVYLGGQYTSKIAELHKKYGPIIRISPHELHIIDPTFFDTLYRMDGHWNKYSWTYDAFGAPNSTIFGSDHNAHKARRRAIAPFFSKAHIASQQDIFYKNTDKLCQRISQFGAITFNLGAAISAFTRDNTNEFLIGKAYNELDLKDFGIALSLASQGAGPFWRITKHIRWFGPALRSIPFAWLMNVADEGTKSFLNYLKQTEQDTCDILTAVALKRSDNKVHQTLIHQIVHSDLAPKEKTLKRISEEIATTTGAGYETTANVLRLILYHIYANNEIFQRLKEEITPAFAKFAGLIPLKELERLPYITAVLKEGMRLSPAIASRTARITNEDLFYGSWRIPAGTPVGMTVLLMHTNETLYPDPMRFDPERWIKNTHDAKFAPFSRGTRMCLGMHMAWAEMYIVLAALVQKFHFGIEGATAGDFELERDNFGIGTKSGCNLMAHVIPDSK